MSFVQHIRSVFLRIKGVKVLKGFRVLNFGLTTRLVHKDAESVLLRSSAILASSAIFDSKESAANQIQV